MLRKLRILDPQARPQPLGRILLPPILAMPPRFPISMPISYEERPMRIVISSGHGKHIRGASGILDEVNEARRVVERTADLLRNYDTEVVTFHDDVSTTQDENLHRIVDFHNSQQRDLDVSVHFNAYEPTTKPMGTEVLYVSQDVLA